MIASETETIYIYTDAAGVPRYQVLRSPGKVFRQRQVSVNNDGKIVGWTWNLEGVERIPYRLPDLLKRKAKGHTIVVVEGEKDADRLSSLGFCATTNAQGAGWRWTSEFVEQFRGGRRHVILTDCDEPGRKAAFDRADLLLSVADDVRLLDLAPDRNDGFDVSDWLDEGHTREELMARIESTPAFKPEAAPSPSAEAPEWDEARPWPTLDDTALYGLAGEIVRAVAPQTEADPAALLFTLLTIAGSIAGKNTRARVHDDDHPPRLFVVIIGGSMTGAKGTGYAALRPFIRAADDQYFLERILGGFGSGEAIVSELQPKDGVPFDPRLLILEPEYARLLAVNGREASTTSMMIRQAWDGYKLEARRSKDKSVAADHHVSCVGHITPDELLGRLTDNDSTNGFGNRFLYAASRRSKKLPFGGDVAPEVVARLAKRLRKATDRAKGRREITFSGAAAAVWDRLYRDEPDRGGLVGALTARAHPQKLRLALTYAILDEADAIEPAHVIAAEACWRYSVATVEHIFGNLRGDTVQDRLLSALREAFPDGLTGAEQAAVFGRNLKAGRLLAARRVLEHDGFVRTEQRAAGEKGGRPEAVSFAVPSSVHTNQHEQTPSCQLIRVDSYVSGIAGTNTGPFSAERGGQDNAPAAFAEVVEL